MTIIITGGTGFLGKRICRKLKEHSHNILSYYILDGYDYYKNNNNKWN